MHERNESDERRRGSTREQSENSAEPTATPGRESLAWIRALANAWEDEGHPDHNPDHRQPVTESFVSARERRVQ
jgi:hypothetical protein